MYFIDNKKFDIIYKDIFNKEIKKEEIAEGKVNFILNNSTFELNEINEEYVEDLFDFIFNKTNFSDKNVFTSVINETTELLQNNIFHFMTEVLLGLGYKVGDFITLNKKQLIQLFILEVSYNKDKINKDIFVDRIGRTFGNEYAEEICNAIGITESQKTKELEEQKELINQLQNL